MGTKKEALARNKAAVAALPKIEENLPHLIKGLTEVLNNDGSSMIFDSSRRRKLAEIARDLRIHVDATGGERSHAYGLQLVLEEFIERFDGQAATVARAAYPISPRDLDSWLNDQKRLIVPVIKRCQAPMPNTPVQHPHAG